MVLLDILDRIDVNLPIIFHRDPWWPNKYKFADEQIAKRGLEVYDYAPYFMSLWEGVSIMSFVSHYQIGNAQGALLQLPKNIVPPEDGKKFLCGLKEVLKRPTGTFNYPWDCVLIAHKSSDEDQIAGKIKLHCDVKQSNGLGPDAVFPLREWTDEDVWNYIDKFKVPQQPDRYDVKNRKELPDKTNNSDYAHVCIACCDKSKPVRSVICPKTGLEVSSALESVPYTNINMTYFDHANN